MADRTELIDFYSMFDRYTHGDITTKTGGLVSVTGKSNRQLDREAFQPRGEATHNPDRHRNAEYDSHDRLDSHGYPEMTKPTSASCRGCGQPIPANQRKCAECLRHHIEPCDMDAAGKANQISVPRVIFAIVEAACDYTALAKGAAACTLLEQRSTNPLEDCQLVDEFDESPATALTNTWGDIQSALRVESEHGAQLLTTVLKHTDCPGRSAPDGRDEMVPRLYDEGGHGIHDDAEVGSTIDTAGDDCWLIPALAVERRPAENRPTRQRIQSSTTKHVDCQHCEETTEHRFSEYEQLPDEDWDGQPIWKCLACGTTQYGPEPE